MTKAHHLIMTAMTATKNRLRPDSYAVILICNCSADLFTWMRRKFRLWEGFDSCTRRTFHVEPNEYIVFYNVFMHLYSELELELY